MSGALAVVMLLQAGVVLPGDEPPSLYEEPFHTGDALYVDQDTFVRPRSDKDYTMGLAYERSGHWVAEQPFLGALFTTLPRSGLDCITGLGGVHRWLFEGGVTRGFESHSMTFGISGFTPRKGDPGPDEPGCDHRGCVLERPEPEYEDRPYASLEYVSTRRTTARDRMSLGTEFTLGILGLRLAEGGQIFIHHNITHDVRPGGWTHQVSDGFEPTARYRASFKYLALRWAPGLVCAPDGAAPWSGQCNGDTVTSDWSDADDHWVDLTWDGQAQLGFYTNVSSGLRARVGRIDSPFWGLDRSPTTVTKAAQEKKRGVATRQRRRCISELYAFASLGGEAWLYNALLQGQIRDSDVRLRFSPSPTDPSAAAPLNRFVWDWTWGLVVRFRDVSLIYQYNRYSPLFDGPHSRPHRFGGVHVTYTKSF